MGLDILQKRNFLRNLTKSYTEGVYSDTPQNKKLGRVGMSYSEYNNKVKNQEAKEEKFSSLSKVPWKLANGKGKGLVRNKIYEYTNKNGKTLYKNYFERGGKNRYSLGKDFSTFFKKELTPKEALDLVNEGRGENSSSTNEDKEKDQIIKSKDGKISAYKTLFSIDSISGNTSKFKNEKDFIVGYFIEKDGDVYRENGGVKFKDDERNIYTKEEIKKKIESLEKESKNEDKI